MNNTNFITSPNAFSAHRTESGFYKKAAALRRQFEQTFSNPLQANSSRFCWDYWNVPNQYRLLRTPAEAFFGKAGTQFLMGLNQYGREVLGCQMISHPWLSVYLDGHYQGLHSDVPHGPWSFVYSLSPYTLKGWLARPFRGGETLIAKPKMLRYFRDFKSSDSDEESQLFYRLPQPFNQLTVFDPRYPHGVSRVEGNDDLLKARVVIHGWFTEPRPMIEGALYKRASGGKNVEPALDLIAGQLIRGLSSSQHTGILSLRLHINEVGNLTRTEVLTAHLTNLMGDVVTVTHLKQIYAPILEHAKGLFPKSSGKSVITLPIEFGAN